MLNSLMVWLYACCGVLCSAYPQHFVHGSVDKIPGYPGRAGTLTGLHPMQVCRCRRPPHPVTFRRSSSTRCGFGAAPAFVCGRPVTGAAQITAIKRLASAAVTPLYRRATNEGIQLFLAGSAGLLQTTEDVRFEQCHGLTAAGRGVVSPENIAFTRWLTHLQDGVLLDEQNCLMLHEIWLQSCTGQRRWEGLPDDVRDTITALFTAKRGDWCGFWSNEAVSVWWNRLCDNVLPEKPCRLTC